MKDGHDMAVNAAQPVKENTAAQACHAAVTAP